MEVFLKNSIVVEQSRHKTGPSSRMKAVQYLCQLEGWRFLLEIRSKLENRRLAKIGRGQFWLYMKDMKIESFKSHVFNETIEYTGWFIKEAFMLVISALGWMFVI